LILTDIIKLGKRQRPMCTSKYTHENNSTSLIGFVKCGFVSAHSQIIVENRAKVAII